MNTITSPANVAGVLSENADESSVRKTETFSTLNYKTKPKRKLKSRSKSKPPVITLNLGDD